MPSSSFFLSITRAYYTVSLISLLSIDRRLPKGNDTDAHRPLLVTLRNVLLRFNQKKRGLERERGRDDVVFVCWWVFLSFSSQASLEQAFDLDLTLPSLSIRRQMKWSQCGRVSCCKGMSRRRGMRRRKMSGWVGACTAIALDCSRLTCRSRSFEMQNSSNHDQFWQANIFMQRPARAFPSIHSLPAFHHHRPFAST